MEGRTAPEAELGRNRNMAAHDDECEKMRAGRNPALPNVHVRLVWSLRVENAWTTGVWTVWNTPRSAGKS